MATDPRMSELIARWKFLRSAGIEPKVEEVHQRVMEAVRERSRD